MKRRSFFGGIAAAGLLPAAVRNTPKLVKEMLFPVGPYTQHAPENAAYNFAVNAGDLKEGWNTFTVLNNAGPVKVGVFA